MIKRSITGFDLTIIFDKPIPLGLDPKQITVLIIALLVMFLIEILQEKGIKIREGLAGQILVVRWAFYYALIFAVIIFGVYGIAYDEASFIYKGF